MTAIVLFRENFLLNLIFYFQLINIYICKNAFKLKRNNFMLYYILFIIIQNNTFSCENSVTNHYLVQRKLSMKEIRNKDYV